MTSQSIRDIRHLKQLKAVREWLGLTLVQAGELCGTSDALFANWQSGHRIVPKSAADVIGLQVANRLTSEWKRDIGVKVGSYQPWEMFLYGQCRKCRAWFELHRARDRHCPECRAKQKHARAMKRRRALCTTRG